MPGLKRSQDTLYDTCAYCPSCITLHWAFGCMYGAFPDVRIQSCRTEKTFLCSHSGSPSGSLAGSPAGGAASLTNATRFDGASSGDELIRALGSHDGDDDGGAYKFWLVGLVHFSTLPAHSANRALTAAQHIGLHQRLHLAPVNNRQVEHQCLLKPRCRVIDQHAFGDTISVI